MLLRGVHLVAGEGEEIDLARVGRWGLRSMGKLACGLDRVGVEEDVSLE